jgi:hypothetical protein
MTPLIALPAATGNLLPELPALTRLLHGATRLPSTAGWRSGVQAMLAPGLSGLVPAHIAAGAVPALQPGSGLCLATPVHVVPGISRMFLAPADTLTVDADELELLRLAFNHEFGAPGLQLHAAGAGWLLEAPFASAASDPDPDSLGGAALTREPAASGVARSLRRLGAEVEMWLSATPVNRLREQRGVPPVNCIWFWGGAEVSALAPPVQRPGGLFSNREADAWLAGLAIRCNTPLQQVQHWDAVRGCAAALVILQPPALGDVIRQLPAWESDWFEPVWRDLATRQLPALRLQIGTSAWQLPASRLTRWLRRSRPWWQSVSA